MPQVLVVDDDPLAARQVAQVLGEEMVHAVAVSYTHLTLPTN